MSQMNPKKFVHNTILHIQFNHHTLPVTPFKLIYLFFDLFILSLADLEIIEVYTIIRLY